jgi:hypothetical protein
VNCPTGRDSCCEVRDWGVLLAVLTRLPDHSAKRLADLLPWNF